MTNLAQHVTQSPPSTRQRKPVTMRRVATASLIGTTIEFYDFFIYATAAALVFPTVFFPNMDQTMSLLASFATFGVAFLARPLGSVVFGHYGDILGRKKTLVWTLLLMGFSTLIIGLLPGYNSGVFGLFENGIGIWGPALLVAMRFIQGLAVGGEWAGAVLLTAEYAPPGQRGKYAMFPQLGASVAYFLSCLTFLVVGLVAGEQSNAFMTWGWRVPFILSIALVVIGLYIRLVIEETPSFEKEQKRRAALGQEVQHRSFPFMDTLRYQWKEAVLGGVALASNFSIFYMSTSYLTSYGVKMLGHSRPEVLITGMFTSVLGAIGIIVSSIYSDKVGRTRVIMWTSIITVLWAPFLFFIIDQGPIAFFALGMSITTIINSFCYGPAGALLPELFRVDLRYTGAGLAYNIGAILGGAIPPLIAISLHAKYGGFAVGMMLAIIALFSLAAISRIRSNHTAAIDSVQ